MAETSSAASSSNAKKQDDFKIKKKPVCLLVLGMAGSGKTEFVKKLSQFRSDKLKPYTINLDPACKETPYQTNIGKTFFIFSSSFPINKNLFPP